MKRAVLLVLVLGLLAGSAAGQDGDFLKQIMAAPDWIGNAPERPYWADDATAVYYSRKRDGEDVRELYLHPLEGEPARVEDAALGTADVSRGSWSRDRRLKLYEHEGDIFLKDVPTGTIRQLTRTSDRESAPVLLDDGRVGFQRGQAVMVRDLESDLEAQVAEVLAEDEPKDDEPEGYLAESERRLIQWVREQDEEEEAAAARERARRAADPTRVPPPFYLGTKIEIRSQTLAPNGEWLLVQVADKGRDRGPRGKMPNYISETGYTTVRDVRSKVGTGDEKGSRLVLLDLVRHEVHELDQGVLPGITDDPLAEVRRLNEEAKKKDEPEAKTEPDEKKSKKAKKAKDAKAAPDDEEPDDEEAAKPREIDWWAFATEPSPAGDALLTMARSRDNKDRWLVLVTGPGEGGEAPELKTVHHLRDEAWINWDHNESGWTADGDVYFLSEETGTSQLYLYDAATGETRRLAGGDYVTQNPQPSPDGRFIYYEANPEHPGVYEVFRVALKNGTQESGTTEQLTSMGGVNELHLAPDGGALLVEHSEALMPPELYVQATEPDAEPRRLTHTVRDEWLAVDWVAPQYVEVPSTHQERPIHARFYPASSERTLIDGKRAAVVFVHGAGYLQNAHQGWSGYFRELMFHTHLSRQGYAVLDMDYRASQGYGRDWRTAIYRRMGTPEVEDLADGVAWLVAEHGVDPARVGVYGGSYGGFLTFMALFKEPDLFAAGAALRPVTDWAHYNHGYTSNILNTPEVDPLAYRSSSPIEHAEGLTKPLLICTGMQDDNVFFQDSVRLVQRLIELEKEDWELAVYPVEKHGFVEPSSWLDEYRRIFKLFEENLVP